MKKYEGMVAAVPTPFLANEEIDFAGVTKLVNHFAASGLHGLLIGGSTGEYSLMSMEERKTLIKTAVQAAAGKNVYIIAGCSAHRPKDTVEMVQYAGSAGADFALVLPPYYMCTSTQGIIDYFRTVGEASQIGIIVYHYPAATTVRISAETFLEISKLPHLVGVKDTAEMDHTCQLIKYFGDDDNFSVINGCEHLIMGTLAAGGNGTMGIIHNLAPKQMRAIWDAMQANDVKTARAINKTLMPLYDMMEEEPFPGPVKAGLELLGLPGGVPRKPIVAPSTELKARLKAAMIEAGLL